MESKYTASGDGSYKGRDVKVVNRRVWVKTASALIRNGYFNAFHGIYIYTKCALNLFRLNVGPSLAVFPFSGSSRRQ